MPGWGGDDFERAARGREERGQKHEVDHSKKAGEAASRLLLSSLFVVVITGFAFKDKIVNVLDGFRLKPGSDNAPVVVPQIPGGTQEGPSISAMPGERKIVSPKEFLALRIKEKEDSIRQLLFKLKDRTKGLPEKLRILDDDQLGSLIAYLNVESGRVKAEILDARYADSYGDGNPELVRDGSFSLSVESTDTKAAILSTLTWDEGVDGRDIQEVSIARCSDELAGLEIVQSPSFDRAERFVEQLESFEAILKREISN